MQNRAKEKFHADGRGANAPRPKKLCQVKLTIFIYTFHMEILFSERIRQLRKEAGLTQARLAKEIGITQRKLSYLESGQSEPDLETIWRLADYFDVTVDYLLGRTEY